MSIRLSSADKRELLRIARSAIGQYLADGTVLDTTSTGHLVEPGAAFVTLTQDGHLRGCIGTITPDYPLAETVARCAIEAAVEDPRFVPLRLEESADIEIEVSVLTPLIKVESLDEIEVGRDGLLIRLGRRSGLLLPQVPEKYGWSREEFLRQTCIKAGLPEKSYLSPDAKLFRFQVDHFEE